MNVLAMSKAANIDGNVNETTISASQLVAEQRDVPNPRMFNGKTSPMYTQVIGAHVHA